MPTCTGAGNVPKWYDNYINQIKAMSDGQIEITAYGSGELLPNTEQFQAVKDGTMELAVSYAGYYADTIDIANIETGIPRSFPTKRDCFVAWNELGLMELAQEAYAEHGIRYLGPVLTGTYSAMSTFPIRSVADLEGKIGRGQGYGEGRENANAEGRKRL